MPGTQRMLNELPLAVTFLSLGRMSGKETYRHGSFWKKRLGWWLAHPHTPRESSGPLFPRRATDKADTQQEGLISLLGASSHNRESGCMGATSTGCTGPSHPHLLLGPGEEDALDIVYACLKAGRHDVGAQIPHLIAAANQGLHHLLLTHGHHHQPGLPSQVP